MSAPCLDRRSHPRSPRPVEYTANPGACTRPSFSGLTLLLALTLGAFYFSRVVKFGMMVRKLWEMHEFYTELLEIPEVSDAAVRFM